MQGKSGGRFQDPEGNCQILEWPKKQGQASGPLGTLLLGASLALPNRIFRIKGLSIPKAPWDQGAESRALS